MNAGRKRPTAGTAMLFGPMRQTTRPPGPADVVGPPGDGDAQGPGAARQRAVRSSEGNGLAVLLGMADEAAHADFAAQGAVTAGRMQDDAIGRRGIDTPADGGDIFVAIDVDDACKALALFRLSFVAGIRFSTGHSTPQRFPPQLL
ncbi:MAG: hypothetical protein U5Q44_08630 [Dehalococcoidia bacterium]|nr:hypothetical protein [Dehalococcoidia bacterium]